MNSKFAQSLLHSCTTLCHILKFEISYLEIARKKNLTNIVSIQNPYSLLNRVFEIGLSEVSLQENVKLLAYSPLGFGILTGKYRLKKMPAKS